MVELLKKMEKTSKKYSIKINASKSKILIFDRANEKGNQHDKKINGIEIGIRSLIYLGVRIINTGDCESEIRCRITLVKTAILKLTRIWKDRGISRYIKIRLIRSLFPIITYVSENWTIKTVDRRRNDAFEMLYWRRMLKCDHGWRGCHECFNPNKAQSQGEVKCKHQ